jgi:hypothetical protein
MYLRETTIQNALKLIELYARVNSMAQSPEMVIYLPIAFLYSAAKLDEAGFQVSFESYVRHLKTLVSYYRMLKVVQMAPSDLQWEECMFPLLEKSLCQ